MLRTVVHEHHRPVFQSAIAVALKLQWCLQRRIAEHALGAVECLAILVQAFQEEEGMVEAGQGEAWQRGLHVAAEVLTVLPLEALGAGRQRVIVEDGGDVRVVPVEVLQVGARVEQPFGIAKHGDVKLLAVGLEAVDLREGDAELLGAARVEHDHVGLGGAEGLREVLLARLQVGDDDVHRELLHAPAQSEGERALPAGRVVAVDDHGVIVAEALYEVVDDGLVLLAGRLVHLEDVAVGGQLRGVDREGDYEADVVPVDEGRQGVHLLGIERSDDEVAAGCVGVGQHLINIVVLGRVPGVHVDGDALLLQAVAGHEHATVVFRHAPAVAVDVVQRQHHAQADGAVPDIVSRPQLLAVVGGRLALRLLSRLALRLGALLALGLRERDVQHHAFLQLIAGGVHLRVGLDELLDGQAIVVGDAEDGLLLLHLVLSADGGRLLGRNAAEGKGYHDRQQGISENVCHNNAYISKIAYKGSKKNKKRIVKTEQFAFTRQNSSFWHPYLAKKGDCL